MPANDHPNGGSYETQSDRFGSGRSYVDMREVSSAYQSERGKPGLLNVQVEVSYTFNETQIKQILAEYVKDKFDKVVNIADIKGEYQSATYHNQLDSSPAYCKFVVKARG